MAPTTLLVSAVLVTALGPGCRQRAPSGDRTPVVLSIGLPVPPTGQAAGVVSQAVSLLSEEGLMRTTRAGLQEGRLAERWDLLDGGLTIRFYLRRGVRFHDGADLTSTIVKASLEASRRDPAEVAAYPVLRVIDVIEVPDPSTLIIRLRSKSAPWLDDLELPIRKWDSTGRASSTGPFVLESATVDPTILRANQFYYRGRSSIDFVQLRNYPTVRAAWAAMMRGEIDFLWEVPADARDFVEEQSGVRVFSALRAYVYTLLFNLRKPVFRDRAVRQALNAAVDRQAIVELALRARGLPTDGPLWPEHWIRNQAPSILYRYNPLQADKALTAAGVPMHRAVPASQSDLMPARLRFTCLIPAGLLLHERLAALVQKQLFDVGVDMQVEAVPLEAFARRIVGDDYDAALVDLVSGYGFSRLYRFWHSAGSSSLGYQGADAALDALGLARDETALRSSVAELQQALQTDPPAVFLAWGEIARAVSRRFEVPNEPGEDVLRTLWQWRPAGTPADRNGR